MYFFMQQGKQYLDLRGDFILTHNDERVKTRTKSAAPVKVVNADYVKNVKLLSFVERVIVTFKVIAFVWGRSEALVPENTNLNKPHVNDTLRCEKSYPDKMNCPYRNNKNGLSCDCSKCNH